MSSPHSRLSCFRANDLQRRKVVNIISRIGFTNNNSSGKKEKKTVSRKENFSKTSHTFLRRKRNSKMGFNELFNVGIGIIFAKNRIEHSLDITRKYGEEKLGSIDNGEVINDFISKAFGSDNPIKKKKENILNQIIQMEFDALDVLDQYIIKLESFIRSNFGRTISFRSIYKRRLSTHAALVVLEEKENLNLRTNMYFQVLNMIFKVINDSPNLSFYNEFFQSYNLLEELTNKRIKKIKSFFLE